jgi:hypothetical protein
MAGLGHAPAGCTAVTQLGEVGLDRIHHGPILVIPTDVCGRALASVETGATNDMKLDRRQRRRHPSSSPRTQS